MRSVYDTLYLRLRSLALSLRYSLFLRYALFTLRSIYVTLYLCYDLFMLRSIYAELWLHYALITLRYIYVTGRQGNSGAAYPVGRSARETG